MASGRFGKAAVTANVDTDLYTCPLGMVATATVALCNRGSGDARVRIAVRSAALTAADYIEYDAILPPNGILERTQIVLSPGEVITVRSDAPDVSARAHGFEEVQ